mgnify:CR=1 FL=1
MGFWAVIPVKPLRRGKSRLADVLSEDERTLLNYSMLENTLKVLSSLQELESIMVVSRDPSALVLAREYGARTVQEDGSPDLNTALKRATLVAQAYVTKSLIIVPADLPLLSKEDILAMINETGSPPEMIIAPDLRRDGTNCLLISPPGPIQYAYGPGSFNRHLVQAQRYGYRTAVILRQGLQLDLDLPEDLDLLKTLSMDETSH